MFLSDLAIRRPVLASMASAALVPFSSSGEQRSNITLEFNLERPIEAAAQDVNNAIRTRNVEVPVGRIESDRREFNIIWSMGELTTPEEFGSQVVSGSAGQLVRLPMSGREVTP
ncbi:MAG TPA: hypothetical protein VMK53_06160 [Gemmatimonadales bacterium]|nr:hypothetical protein [Gemmatimonadales bacterium]